MFGLPRGVCGLITRAYAMSDTLAVLDFNMTFEAGNTLLDI
jgi:hypothetical protein